MNLQQRKLIISAELYNLTSVENEARTRLLKDMLDDLNLGSIASVGNYMGNKDVSFIIPIFSSVTFEVVSNIAFKNFNQESILEINPDNTSFLIYQTGKEEYLGLWQETTLEHAMKQASHTIALDRAFIVA